MNLKRYAAIENGVVVNFINADENSIHSYDEIVCVEDEKFKNQLIDIGTKYENGIFVPTEKQLEELQDKKRLEELQKITNLFDSMRFERNVKLRESDIIMFKHIEKGEEVPSKLHEYRQSLRDLPENITDIENIDWPEYP